MFWPVRVDQILNPTKNLFTTWRSCKKLKTLSIKRSWLLLAGHPFFLVILCQCTLKNCEHRGGWERTEKKNITQCKYKEYDDEKDQINFYFEKKTAVCRTVISYKLKTTANNTLRSCLAFAIADYDTFILSAGIC